jgi:hypothetical protein
MEDALKELGRERSEAEHGSQLVWQTHTELADQRCDQYHYDHYHDHQYAYHDDYHCDAGRQQRGG